MTEPQMVSQSSSPESSTPLHEGSTIETSILKPFEGFTYIRKEWIDQEDGIEKVTFNTTLGKINLPADWSRTESYVMMPKWGTDPLKRTWIVRLPTHLDGKDRYLFHYFFQVFYSTGTDRVSNFFSQIIVPQSFEFLDHSGEMIFIRLHWSLGNWAYPQDTEMEVEGIDWGSEFSISNAPYRSTDKLFQSGRFLLIKRLSTPRRFRGIIWAPKGADIRYCFQLHRYKPDGNEIHWDNNFGKNYSVTI